MTPAPDISIRSASVTRLRRRPLRHARRRVLLLLGMYCVPLHNGILRYAREADWVLDDSYVRMGALPVVWRGDGILGLITNPKDVVALRNFAGLPLVDFSKGWISDSMPAKYRASGMGQARVYYDNIGIARMAAQHFLERGFKHIAFMNCGNYWMEVERIPSFRQEVEAAGRNYLEIPYHQCFPKNSPGIEHDYHKAHRWLVELLRQLPKPVAIATSADAAAIRLLHACEEAGLGVPEEVAVLGCDNDPQVCDYAPVPLSSVDCDWERIGYEGAMMLDRIMDGMPAPLEPLLIPPKGVVTRLSTNILAVSDLQIARAVRFIWEHYPEAIGTDEVAAAAGMSRRALERDFRKHLGRSVHDEIILIRIERAKKLLLESDLKVADLAEQCGFGNAFHFTKAFTRITGVRPSHYRRGGR